MRHFFGNSRKLLRKGELRRRYTGTFAADAIGRFLATTPKDWANIIDSDKALEDFYQFERFPSLFLIDKAGRIQVAQPHVVGLEDAVKRLLDE